MPLFSAQAAISSYNAPRGEVYRVVNAPTPAWRHVSLTLLTSLERGWSQFGCDPADKDFHHLDFLIPLKVEAD